MNRHLLIVLVAATGVASLIHAAPPRHGGGPWPGWSRSTPCLTPEQHQAIRDEIAANISALESAGVLSPVPEKLSVPLGWPLSFTGDAPGYHGMSSFVDHDPSYPDHLLDYNCGERTYDTSSGYNHTGSDFFTWPFSWLKMDTDQVAVVAAAPGTIVSRQDGYYDRNCGSSSTPWNAVAIRHSDLSIAWYGHLKNGSVTAKGVGHSVAGGEYLGIIGSSGNSTGPHLHFELYDGSGSLNDPCQGACNSMNPASWWQSQRPYYDSAVNELATHDAEPEFPDCPQQEIPHYCDDFDPGDRIYFVTYYRDHLPGQLSDYAVYRPDASVFASWSDDGPPMHWAASYWWWWWDLPGNASTGTWRFEVDYEGVSYRHTFTVGGALFTDGFETADTSLWSMVVP